MFVGFVVPQGVVVFQRPPTHLALETLLGREFQVRSYAAASDRSSSTLIETRRRAHEFHRSVSVVHPPPGTIWIEVSILWDMNPRTCRPLRDELYPCTPASLFSSLMPLFSTVYAVQKAYDNMASPIGRSSAPRSLATPHHLVVRTQLSRFLVRTPTGHDERR